MDRPANERRVVGLILLLQSDNSSGAIPPEPPRLADAEQSTFGVGRPSRTWEFRDELPGDPEAEPVLAEVGISPPSRILAAHIP